MVALGNRLTKMFSQSVTVLVSGKSRALALLLQEGLFRIFKRKLRILLFPEEVAERLLHDLASHL
jgi:hypothetical protein